MSTLPRSARARQTRLLRAVRRPFSRLSGLAGAAESRLALGDLAGASMAAVRAEQIARAYLLRRDEGCRK